MSARFGVQLDPKLRDSIAREAEAQGRTVPGQINWILSRWLNNLAIQRSKAMQQQQSPHDALTASLMKINGDQ
jgi:hypothetical protein